MNGVLVALIVLLVLFLLGQIRIGAQVEYCEQGLFVHIRAGAVLIPVFPRKEKKKKPESPKAPKPSGQLAEHAPKGKKGGRLKLALKFIPLVLDTVKKFRRKLRMDKIEMALVVGADDPADAAVRYGQANALLGSLWTPVTQAFHVKDGHAHVGLDFDSDKPTIYILTSLSLTIAQTLGLALAFGVKALGILIRNRTKQREAV